eukprot:766612-Hanusia_phi.AAC.5
MDPSSVTRPPPKLIYRDGKPVRANLLWQPTKWISTPGNGILVPIPGEIFQAGLKQADFEAMLKELEEIRRQQESGCSQCAAASMCFVCAGTFVLLPCAYYFQRMRTKQRVVKYDQDLRRWQEEMNLRYLQAQGCYVKSQSCARRVGVGDHSRREIEHWIAIALTPEESQRLASEPHVFGQVLDLSCCYGVKEEDMCMHP